jgi:hypothetical protein
MMSTISEGAGLSGPQPSRTPVQSVEQSALISLVLANCKRPRHQKMGIPVLATSIYIKTKIFHGGQ